MAKEPLSLPAGERGAALLLALAALSILGILGAAAIALAWLEVRAGENAVQTVQSFEAAEAGLAQARWTWNHAAMDTLSAGGVTMLPGLSLVNGAQVAVQARRLGGETFLITSQGQIQRAGRLSRRFLSQLIRLELPIPPISGALTGLDSVLIDAGSVVSGIDSIPAGWGARCPATVPPVAGLAVSPGTVVNPASCLTTPCLRGQPGLLVDSMLPPWLLDSVASYSYSGLASQADVTVQGAVGPVRPVPAGPGACQAADTLNWGDPDPAGACGSYFPVVHAASGLVISGGSGQGVLLVDGDLTLSGAFRFVGLVVVQGTLHSGGAGGGVLGAVLARRVDLSPGSPLEVRYSACALREAMRGRSRPRSPISHGWGQLF
ncbi:MAG: hypothetical protein AB7Q69_14785 [Gemmatimonadales bacterium]